MKHIFKKHKHHLGIWALSGLILLWSIIWLNDIEKKTKEQRLPPPTTPIATSSLSSAVIKNQSSTATVAASVADKILLPTKFSTSSFATSSTAKQENKENLATFEFISPSNEKKLQIAIAENETVYQAMLRLKQEQGLSFEVKDYSGIGAFVESIDGLANNPKENQFWIYYLNGKVATMGISLTKVHYNDLITWRYENSKF